jgi:hypothetical protein
MSGRGSVGLGFQKGPAGGSFLFSDRRRTRPLTHALIRGVNDQSL